MNSKYDKLIDDLKVDPRYVEILKNYKFKSFLEMKPSK